MHPFIFPLIWRQNENGEIRRYLVHAFELHTLSLFGPGDRFRIFSSSSSFSRSDGACVVEVNIFLRSISKISDLDMVRKEDNEATAIKSKTNYTFSFIRVCFFFTLMTNVCDLYRSVSTLNRNWFELIVGSLCACEFLRSANKRSIRFRLRFEKSGKTNGCATTIIRTQSNFWRWPNRKRFGSPICFSATKKKVICITSSCRMFCCAFTRTASCSTRFAYRSCSPARWTLNTIHSTSRRVRCEWSAVSCFPHDRSFQVQRGTFLTFHLSLFPDLRSIRSNANQFKNN